ncbi:MAG: flagellar biosynthesis protein FlhB [Syntrophorhabdaceae bacterium]|nr:flagellar biosynthesis protein FlhB [Syntrophorhabdaceae bacterium]
MAEDRYDRTEKATGRQRQKALEKGQVARSRELVSMAATGGIMMVIVFWGGATVKSLSVTMRRFLSLQYGTEPINVLRSAGVEIIVTVLPFLLSAAALAIVASLAQGGLVMKPLTPQLSKLNPMEGLKRIFSTRGLTELGKNLLKVIAGGYVTWITIRKELKILPFLPQFDLSEVVRISGGLVIKAFLTGFAFFFVIAILDYFLQWWQHEKSLMMTKKEVKDDHKDSEGNPQIKGKIRSLMREMVRRRMMQELPKATVVITNPTHFAVALRYDSKDMDAPQIVAKGMDFLAEKIRDVARKHGIPIIEDKPLARSLYKVDLGASVPEELYRAVARILAMIMSRHREVR